MANMLMMKGSMTAFVLQSALSQIFAMSRWYAICHIPQKVAQPLKARLKSTEGTAEPLYLHPDSQ